MNSFDSGWQVTKQGLYFIVKAVTIKITMMSAVIIDSSFLSEFNHQNFTIISNFFSVYMKTSDIYLSWDY